ncbi:hypothetical protein ACLB2K_058591 [Fragaria x ananassa]
MSLRSLLSQWQRQCYREQKPKSIVGGNLGWTIPPGGAATYASWASKYTFKVNKDLLGFNFEAGENDLILVTKENFHTCNTAEPFLQFEGPVYIGSANPGTLYFTCSFAGHCQKRQKVAIDFEPSSNLACCLVQVQVHVPWPVRVLPMNLRPPNISK